MDKTKPESELHRRLRLLLRRLDLGDPSRGTGELPQSNVSGPAIDGHDPSGRG